MSSETNSPQNRRNNSVRKKSHIIFILFFFFSQKKGNSVVFALLITKRVHSLLLTIFLVYVLQFQLIYISKAIHLTLFPSPLKLIKIQSPYSVEYLVSDSCLHPHAMWMPCSWHHLIVTLRLYSLEPRREKGEKKGSTFCAKSKKLEPFK